MPPLPRCWLIYIPVDLWIIRKTYSDHVWADELACWSFTPAKNRFLWLFFKFKSLCLVFFWQKSRKRKKNPLWANVKIFCFPFYLNCIIVHLGFVCFTVWPMSLGMMLSNHCQCENISEDGKDKHCSSQTGLLYIYMDKNVFSLWS